MERDKNMIIDTHVHYDDEAFNEDREELLMSLRANGIDCVIDIGSSAESLPRVLALTEKYDFVYGAVGLHPDEVGDLTGDVMADLREDMKNPKILAVGEIGLDYYWNKEAKEIQKEAFRKQVLLAQEFGKPVVIHSREAAADTLEIVQEMYGPGSAGEHIERKGVMHCYCSHLQEREEAEGGRGGYTYGISDPRDRLPVSRPGAFQGKEEFFFISSVCGECDCRT